MPRRFSLPIQADSPGSGAKPSLPSRRCIAVVCCLALALLGAPGAACSSSTDAEVDPRPSPKLQVSIELPQERQVELPFVISGWAIDSVSKEGPGIDAVEVLDGGCRGALVGIAVYGIERGDVAREYGTRFLYSGWHFGVTRLHGGERTLAIRVTSKGSETFDRCEVIPVFVSD